MNNGIDAAIPAKAKPGDKIRSSAVTKTFNPRATQGRSLAESEKISRKRELVDSLAPIGYAQKRISDNITEIRKMIKGLEAQLKDHAVSDSEYEWLKNSIAVNYANEHEAAKAISIIEKLRKDKFIEADRAACFRFESFARYEMYLETCRFYQCCHEFFEDVHVSTLKKMQSGFDKRFAALKKSIEQYGNSSK